MKIILLQDVRGVGRKYDVRDVSLGYARNFLMPRKLGKEATPAALNEIKSQKENWEKQTAALHEKLKKLQDTLETNPLIFKLKLGEKDEVFGSIGKRDIEKALLGKDKDSLIEVNLVRPIKTLGEHKVEVNLGRGVTGEIKVKIEKDLPAGRQDS